MKSRVTAMGQAAPRRQQGAIMVLCLVILFSMTLIGVSSMDSAVLELKMPNTMQNQVVALNRAEAELKKANGGFGVCMNGCGGRCGGCNCMNTAAPSSGGWW